jgi:hypothetical protein
VFSAPARAYFAGRVEKADVRVNPVTGQQFHWALVDMLGGKVDLVADGALAPEPFKPGMIVQGEFWLCGRLVEDTAEA